jgi:hypothetical protein
MGACFAKLQISPDLAVVLKANPDPSALLVLQLHYNCYDKKSQRIIDECTQLAISPAGALSFATQACDAADAPVKE